MKVRLLALIYFFAVFSIIVFAEESLIYITLGECPDETVEIFDF